MVPPPPFPLVFPSGPGYVVVTPLIAVAISTVTPVSSTLRSCTETAVAVMLEVAPAVVVTTQFNVTFATPGMFTIAFSPTVARLKLAAPITTTPVNAGVLDAVFPFDVLVAGEQYVHQQ